MLAKARQNFPRGEFANHHINNFYGLYDLVFSNAALHWIDEHEILMQRLLSHTKKVLAIQMPHNFSAPSHVLLRETVLENPKWCERLQPALRAWPVLSMHEYYDIIQPKVQHIDIWQTEYLHVLNGKNAILEWASGTALVPVENILNANEFNEFKQIYNAKLHTAYPETNNQVLFPFKRIFIVAVKNT